MIEDAPDVKVKRKIIFVDDEPNVIQGLRRMLHGMRGEWEMVFAGSGKEALGHLEQEKFDVIISDMRMPGMDGAQLLSEVRERYPNMVRIVLSGQSDEETVIRSIGPTHQYLSKPCDANTIKATVARACSLRDFLRDEKLQHCVASMKSVPSLPSLYVRLLEELRSPSPSIAKVGEVISSDVGMTAKILQLVNSAFFGINRHVSSPTQAVNFLGLETIKALVLSAQAFSQFEKEELPAHLTSNLWNHSVAAGSYAKTITRLEGASGEISDHAFLAGLLHDIGKLVLAVNFRDTYDEVLQLAETERVSLAVAESKLLGVTHAEVGGNLLGLWGLPNAIMEAVTFHHYSDGCPEESFTPLTAVYMANILQHEIEPRGSESEQHIDLDYLDRLGLTSRIDTWRDACRNLVNKGDQ
ncbi:MAG: HDOD domain-containing protein [Candidatus Coatesbacteria bacterium]|nr:HDOD domain-containing protein [Candidatus Coatesbacteria bacterium]